MADFEVVLTHTSHFKVSVSADSAEEARETIRKRLQWSGLMARPGENDIKEFGNPYQFDIIEVKDA